MICIGTTDTFIIYLSSDRVISSKDVLSLIRLLLCSRIESISFCLFVMSSFSSLFSVSKNLILASKLSTVPWSIVVEIFRIFADFNDLFFMVWSSSMKNDFISIILSRSFASSESNCKLNNELITEFEWNGWGMQGVTNYPFFGLAIVGSDMWVGMIGFIVALMTLQSTWGVIQTSSCILEKLGESDDNVIKGL